MSSPASQAIIEVVKADLVVSVGIGPLLFSLESKLKFPLHLQEIVQRVNIVVYVFLAEVRVERLQSEVLENLLAFGGKETLNFLDASLLEEQSFVLKLTSVVGVVSHQEFRQVDARVEAFSDAGVNGICEKS